MAELNINIENMYNSRHIESSIKSKDLLNYHIDTYNEYKAHIKKVADKIKAQVLDFNKIKKRISSSDIFLNQLEEVEKERQSLYKKRNDYFQSKKFTNPNQGILSEDAIIRHSLNKDENYNYIGGIGNIVFNLSSIKDKPRFAEAILRQTSVSVDYIKLSSDQIDLLKDITYSEIDSDYWSALDDLDTIEEELTHNRQYIEKHLSELLRGLL